MIYLKSYFCTQRTLIVFNETQRLLRRAWTTLRVVVYFQSLYLYDTVRVSPEKSLHYFKNLFAQHMFEQNYLIHYCRLGTKYRPGHFDSQHELYSKLDLLCKVDLSLDHVQKLFVFSKKTCVKCQHFRGLSGWLNYDVLMIPKW